MNPRAHQFLEAGLQMGGLFLAAWLAPHTLLLSTVQLFCLLYAAHSLAPQFAPKQAPAPALVITLGALIGLQSIFQVIAYYLSIPLTLTTDIGMQGLTLFIAYALSTSKHLSPEPSEELDAPPSTYRSYLETALLLVPTLIGSVFIIYHAERSATVEAIRTPWNLLPIGTLSAYLLIIGSAWLAAWRRTSTTLVWCLSALFFITFALLTPLVYPLGFGFDGFLHRASEKLLLTTGTLSPKPLYYMGQYVLTTWLARTLSLSLDLIDTFLLVGSLIILPASLALKRDTKLRQSAILLAGLALLIPLKPWISTTPQSFAYLIGLSSLFLAHSKEHRALIPSLILGMWSVFIHPLAGLPLLGASLLCLWQQQTPWRPWIKNVGAIFIALGTILIVPLAFFLIRSNAQTEAVWHINALSFLHPLELLTTFFRAPAIRISAWADWSAFVEFLFPLILPLLAFIGISKTKESSLRSLTGVALLIMAAAYIMQHIVDFTFLIEYERQDYTQRLMLVGQLILLPAALVGLTHAWQRARSHSTLGLYGFLILVSAWQGARIYRAIPYHDATHIEHGWNVSQYDHEAVRWIERVSQGKPYTVLANQSVSAAAIKELGFKRYTNDTFFYPIPTGGPLYQVFLNAASTNASLKDIERAGALGDSSLVYLVLNDYWWQATEVADVLSTLTHAPYELGGGAVRIYTFDLNKERKR